MSAHRRDDDVTRIEAALDEACAVLDGFTPGAIASTRKAGGDPLTEADLAVDAALRSMLPLPGEGWLSEETIDAPDRLGKRRVWVVDPIDGTREFIKGLPQWCVSVGLIEDGVPVAGGIHSPATGERFLGVPGAFLDYRGDAESSGASALAGARVGASHSEIRRGEWKRFEHEGFEIVPIGSVAYKLALVAAGILDATWTLVPKNEWDVAAGAALIHASGGWLALEDGTAPTWNKPDPLVSGMIATTQALKHDVKQLLL